MAWAPLWSHSLQMGLKAGKLGGQLVGPVDGEGGAGGTDRLLELEVVEVNHGNKTPVVGG